MKNIFEEVRHMRTDISHFLLQNGVPPEQLLNEDQARRKLNLSPRVFSELVRKNEIPHVQLSQKTRRFRNESLDRWAKDMEQGGPP